MSLDRRASSHDEGRGIRRLVSPGVNCGYSDVIAVGESVYKCQVCKMTMAITWPANVLAAGLPLPKWPKKG